MPRSRFLPVIIANILTLVVLAGCWLSIQMIPVLPLFPPDVSHAPDRRLWHDIGRINAVSSIVPVDSDHNGLFNSLDVTVTATTTISGNYSLIATLVDTKGEFVTTAVFSSRLENQPLEVGKHVIPLSFDGETIRHHGADGPYRIDRLTLEGDGYGVTTIDEVINVQPTDSLRARQFEGPLVLIRTVTDEPRDTDSDGHDDTLAVLVELEIIQPGEYQWDGRLVDKHQNEIGMTQGIGQLGEQATVILSFDARSIASSNIDGPYTLSLFAIGKTDGSGQGLTEIQPIHTTKSYLADDFE